MAKTASLRVDESEEGGASVGPFCLALSLIRSAARLRRSMSALRDGRIVVVGSGRPGLDITVGESGTNGTSASDELEVEVERRAERECVTSFGQGVDS